jgi:hypothetical protein
VSGTRAKSAVVVILSQVHSQALCADTRGVDMTLLITVCPKRKVEVGMRGKCPQRPPFVTLRQHTKRPRQMIRSLIVTVLTMVGTISAYAQNCSGNAAGDIFFTRDPGVMTYVNNKVSRLVHFKAINPGTAEVPIDVPPGGKLPIAIQGRGFVWTACTANY